MCFTVDQIDRACGLLLLTESNTFVYCCKQCQCEFETGPNLEVHILTEHGDESVFVVDDVMSNDCAQGTENWETTSLLTIELDPLDIKTECDALDDDQQGEVVTFDENLEQNGDISVNENINETAVFGLRSTLEMVETPKKSTEARAAKNPEARTSTHSSPLFHCEYCPEVKFDGKQKIRSHMRIHVKKKRFGSCTIPGCGPKYTTFEEHMDSYHRQNQPFKCTECDASFATRNNLKSHERFHTDAQPFECELCSEIFDCQISRQNHEILKHSKGGVSLFCEFCNRPFLSKQRLDTHRINAHSNVLNKCKEPLNTRFDSVLKTQMTSEINEDKKSTASSDLNLIYDPNFGSSYGFTENKGNRRYFLLKSVICLKAEHITKLKTMSKKNSFDSTFISVLLSATFGDDVLRESSAGGRKSNYNNAFHKALDVTKLKFIRDLFEERVKNNTARMSQFVKIVNKKCNNLRRAVMVIGCKNSMSNI